MDWNIFKKKTKKAKSKKVISKKKAFSLRKFFSHPDHAWMSSDADYLTFFAQFFEIMPDHILEKIESRNIRFLSSMGDFALSVGSHKSLYAVIVLEKTRRLMLSASKTQAMAILAHELGHIFLRHQERDMEMIQCQKEADAFAIDMGLGEEIIAFLKDHSFILECHARLRFAQSYFNKVQKQSH